MWEKFFNGEVAVYASTKADAARFIKAYMDTGKEKLSDKQQAFAARDDIEFSYNFCDNQIGWASYHFDGAPQGWHERNQDWRADERIVSNPGAPYTSITVKEFFGDEN